MSDTPSKPSIALRPNPADRRPALQPPQFSLVSIMWMVAGLCVLFALMPRVGPYGSFLLILGTAAVALHVIGNALGMQLRENGDTALDEQGRPLSREPRQRPKQHHFAPTTSLGKNAALGRIFFVLTISGAMIGAVVGTLILRWLMGPGASIPSWLIAVLSSAVLGGFLGFLISSFTKVFFDALLHASRDPKRR